jgi:pimeloyl-ACP methyl ester carboxylesterase
VEYLPHVHEPKDAQEALQRQACLAEGLWRILGGRPLDTPLDVRPVAEEQREGYRLERFWFRSEPDIILPAVLARPDTDGTPDVYIYMLDGGKESLTEAEALSHLQQGHAVFAFDPRGMGETTPDRNHDFLSALALGRPMEGMRAWDVMRSVTYLQSRQDLGRVHLIARGSLTVSMPGLLAAALDRRIASVSLCALPATLRQPMTAEGTDGLYLPGLLQLADLPDIMAMVAPRPLAFKAILDERLQPLGPDDAATALAPVRHVYELLGHPDAVTVG